MEKLEEQDYNRLYKIIVVGDASVGKTHMVQKYIKGYAPKNPTPTIGVQFGTKTIPLQNGDKVKAQIWDTTGQERYRAVTLSHYRNAQGAIIVYDVTKENSFRNAALWLQQVRQHADPNVQIMLVGNKCDLPSRVVSIQTARHFAHSQGILFEQTSALNLPVHHIFQNLCASTYSEDVEISSKKRIATRTSGAQLNPNNVPPSQNCSC